MVPKYTPRRIISTKDDLAYNIKRLKKYGNLIIRPLTSKYYDGKFILHNKVEQEKGRTTKDREHYHRYVIDSEGTGKTVKYIGKRYKHTHDIKEGEVLSYSNHNHELISDLNKRIVFKPAPDVTENYIRWRIRNPNLFVDGSFRTIIISKRQKIKAVVGKFKSDPNGSTHVQTVLFDRKKWTVAKARKWIKEHSNSLKSIAKEDDLGQLDSPSGDDMPRPVTSLKTYRCKECDFEFQSNKKETECPICKGKVVLVNNNKSEDVTMRKDIDLPRDNSIPSLKEKMIQKVIGVGVFKQTQITKSIPFFKLAMYSKAIQEVVKSTDNEVKIIDLQWGEKYIPASYEFLETKRDISERLMISGYILAKGDKPFVIHFYPGYNVQHMNIIGKRQDQEFLNKLLTDVDTYVHKNNPWKGEQVTPFGRFLKKEDITLDKVIIAKEVKQRLEKTIFSFFDSKDKYIKADIPFKRGAIFSGVPGTGKTLSGKVIMNTVSGNAYNCECLKCGHKLSSNSHCRDIKCPECGGDMRRADRPGIGKSNTPKDNQKEGVTFIWVTAKDFASVGTGQLFDMARELQPAVLFIEDVDRCLTGSTVDTIKTEMDGMESNNGILTILSTNFPNQLPKTLIDRPGRFDDIIEFELPDSVLRFKILWMYSKKIDIVNKKEALAEISRITKGLTPAHLKEIVVSSYMNCKNDRVTIEDLKKNTDRVTDLHSRFNFNSGKYQKNCYSSLYKKIIESAKRQKKAKSTI